MPNEIEFILSDPSGVKEIAKERAQAAEENKNAPGFASEIGRAIHELDQLQLSADHEAEQVAMGGGNLHEVALALEKADLSMKLAMRIRQKVVETYNEVMRMSV